MCYGTLDAEVGDALRSWCNTTREDAPSPGLALDTFEAAVTGYLSGADSTTTPAERAAIVPGLERITLELSARFAADALVESYFGWDAEIAPTQGDHNLLRAHNQLGLARQVADRRETLLAIVAGV